MQFTPEQKQSLAGLIEGELGLAKSMLNLLEREYEALTDGNPEQINAISKQKLEHLERMEQHLGAFNLFLLDLGVTANTNGAEQAINGMGPDTKMLSNWDELRSMEIKLQRQNEINGGIITLGQRRVKQALDILKGRDNLTGTYSQNGEAEFNNSNNFNTKA